MYTVDPFDPQASKHSKNNLSRLLKEDKSLFGASLVSHNHKDNFTKEPQMEAFKMPPKSALRPSIKPNTSSPLQMVNMSERRYLDVKTNYYELPLTP